MKKLLGLFALLVILLVGCSKEKDCIDDFYGYRIQNTDGIDNESLNVYMVSPDSTFLSGIKNRKIWIGLFNEQTKEQLQEWEGTEILADSVKSISVSFSGEMQDGCILRAQLLSNTYFDGETNSQYLILHDSQIDVINFSGGIYIYENVILGLGYSNYGKIFSLKGEVLVDGVSSYPANLSYPNSQIDSIWLSGIKNQKIWVGLFNGHTKKQIQTWEGIDILSDNVKGVNLREPYKIKNDFVFPAILNCSNSNIYNYEDDKQELFFLYDNKINQVNCAKNVNVSVFEDVALVSERDQNNKLFSSKGELLVNDVSSYNKGDSTFLSGFKDDKIWFGMYNTDKKLLKEWISNNKFERTIIYDAGYGEIKEIYVDCIFALGNLNKVVFLEKDWGYALSSPLSLALPAYNPKGLFLLNDDNVYFYFDKGGFSDVVDWFNGSLLIPGRVIMSLKGELIENISYVSNYYNYDKKDAVTYTEIVHYVDRGAYYHYMVRSDLKEGKEIWKTKIDKLDNIQSDAKVTHTITQKNGQIWTYHYEVVNFDGSKESFDFSINVETGVLTYL